MGKKRDMFDLTGVDPIRVVSEHVNKSGKLKGNKKEVKAFRSICEHHLINKKGKKVKAKLEVHGKNCTCKICRETMPMEFYDDQAVERAIKPAKQLMSQAKLIAGATNADLKTQQRVCEANLHLDAFPGLYKSLRKVAEKREKVKKQKKNKEKHSAYDSWYVRK